MLASRVGEAREWFPEMICDAAVTRTTGYGLDDGVQMGPVISKRHQEKVLGYIEKGIKEGAKLILDGRGIKVPGYPNGFYIGPTVFDQVRPEMTIAREEIFGPVVSLIRVKNLDEGIQLAQNCEYGNAACLYTTNGKTAREFKYRIPASMLGINIGIAAPMAFFPFGGAKGSFFGDIKGHGREVVQFFTDTKVVIQRWL